MPDSRPGPRPAAGTAGRQSHGATIGPSPLQVTPSLGRTDRGAQPSSQAVAPAAADKRQTAQATAADRTGTGSLAYQLVCCPWHGLGTQNVRSCAAYGGHADHPVVMHVGGYSCC